MAHLEETPVWEDEIYQLEITDPVQGGPGGIDNRQANQLGNRTQYLKEELEKIVASDTTPKVNGDVSTGSETAYARGDHVHPTDSTRAPLASPEFTGTPKVPEKTNAATSDGTLIATEAQVALKADLESPVFTGVPEVPSKATAAADNGTLIATEAQVYLKADLESPVFTGTPKVPSKTGGASSSNPTLIATEAQVALKANLAGPTFTGTPKLTGDHPLAVAPATTSDTESNLPVGSYILVCASEGYRVSRNAAKSDTSSEKIFFFTGNSYSYYVGSTPTSPYTVLSGTWRSSGMRSEYGEETVFLFRRTV